MIPRDLLDRVSITNVWATLGGPPLRHGRGQAWWRDGDSHNVALHEGRSLWYDHARNEGGGILHLVQLALGCDRRAALEWLANYEGVDLEGGRTLSAAERRQDAQRRKRAEAEAHELTQWREDYLDALRTRRNQLWDRGRHACALGLRLLRESGEHNPLWELVWRHFLDDLEGDAVDAERERVHAMDPRGLIAFRESLAEGKKTTAAT